MIYKIINIYFLFIYLQFNKSQIDIDFGKCKNIRKKGKNELYI